MNFSILITANAKVVTFLKLAERVAKDVAQKVVLNVKAINLLIHQKNVVNVQKMQHATEKK